MTSSSSSRGAEAAGTVSSGAANGSGSSSRLDSRFSAKREVVGAARTLSNPAAITVTRTSSPRASSITAPKMMFASGCATRVIVSAALFTSCSVRPVGPATESSNPRAPSIEDSSSGDEIADRAASSARSSPEPWPIPINADPAPVITERTSAKSRLIRPGVVMSDVMPSTP